MGRRNGYKSHTWTKEDEAALEAAVKKLGDIGYMETLVSQGGRGKAGSYWTAVAGVLAVEHGLKVTGNAAKHRMDAIRKRRGEPEPKSEQVSSDAFSEIIAEGLEKVALNQINLGDAITNFQKLTSEAGHERDQEMYRLLNALVQTQRSFHEQQKQVAFLLGHMQNQLDALCGELSIKVRKPDWDEFERQTQEVQQ